MKSHLMKGVAVVGVIAATTVAGGAHAQAFFNTDEVIGVKETYKSQTRTECTSSSAGVPGWLGQALGGVIGAGVGSQVGKGTGSSAAAAAGAVLGAQAGAAMSGNGQPQQTCRNITENVHDGYLLRTRDGHVVHLPLSLVNSFNAGR